MPVTIKFILSLDYKLIAAIENKKWGREDSSISRKKALLLQRIIKNRRILIKGYHLRLHT